MVTGIAFYVALPAFTKVVSAWPKLFHLSFFWLFMMLLAEIVSFACAATLLRILLRTKLWFSVVAALLVGNAVTNVLPAGDVAGAGVQFQMLSMGGIDSAQAGGGLAVSAIIGLAGLFILPVCAVPAILGGVPISPGLEHAAILGIVGFVLIIGAGAILLTTDRPLMKLASAAERLLNALPKRKKQKTTDLGERLVQERNLVRTNLGRRWREAVLLIGGRIGFDYIALLAALRATGARPNAPLVVLAYAATAVIALFPITPGGLGVVEASLSGLLVLAGVPSGRAIIATLAYRLVTYWLPIFAGGGIYIAFRRRYGPVKFGASSRATS